MHNAHFYRIFSQLLFFYPGVSFFAHKRNLMSRLLHPARKYAKLRQYPDPLARGHPQYEYVTVNPRGEYSKL